ncbi:MAG TPA: hypothetical protein VFV97_06445, partial [Rhodanobacteraceae bacterium]|nr:hypothetical protein [Rhodanobacteraceae bacterium]
MSRFVLIVLAFVSLAATAAPPDDQWFTVLLDGRKIGSFESTRDVRDGRVVTSQTLDLSIERAGTPVGMTSRETTEETTDGKPLAFQALSKLSGGETTIDGTVHGDKATVKSSTGGATQTREIAWPKGAMLPEGLRLAGLAKGLSPGTRYSALAFQPSSLDVAEITTHVGAKESVDLPGGAKTLTAVEQTMLVGGAPVKSRLWVDA